jgi:hypothetical protein
MKNMGKEEFLAKVTSIASWRSNLNQSVEGNIILVRSSNGMINSCKALTDSLVAF